jgi:tetratricopeptide (TPR) repeat protein
MKTVKILIAAAAVVAIAVPARPNAAPQAEVDVIASSRSDLADRDDDDDKKVSRMEREEALYDAASDMLDEHEWRKAATTFQRVAEMRMSHADAALYWMAHAQYKMGQRSEALATLVTLQKSYPKSRWVEDGKKLEVEIRQSAGQHIDAQKIEDEELKLMALSGLMSNDAEHAVPLLENIINNPKAAPKLRERALFVLSQSSSPKATEILSRLARGGDPELQSKAIRYIGMMGGDHNRQLLSDIYASASDVSLKKSILKSFMISGDRSRLLNVARTESNQELRGDAITQLGLVGARNELGDLYSSEPSTELRKKIIQAMFLGGNSEKLGEIAKAERNEELRLTAIKNLGLLGGSKSGAILVSIYQTDNTPEVRRAVINGLFLQNNGSALVQLARAEKDPELKKSIISKLSIMHSKEAADYLMEFLRE